MPIAFKTPAEIKPVLYDFEDELAGATIADVDSVIATGPQGDPDPLTFDTSDKSDSAVAVIWKGGTDGSDYSTVVRVVTSDGTILETGGDVSVRGFGPVVPDIPGTYLSAASYIDRFGRNETIDLTCEDQTGRIDYDKLAKALQDSTQTVDSYLSGTYTLPLAQPYPLVIETIVADLTRERLHVNAPPPEVTAAAGRARDMLKDLSKGIARLPTATGEPTPQLGISEPIATAAPRIFTPDRMDRYSSNWPGTSGQG